MTPNESCNAIFDAVATWRNIQLHQTFDWHGIRRALATPVSSPFIMRDDMDKHLQYMRNPENGNVLCTYRTKAAKDLAARMYDAALAENQSDFSEHFYTALEL